MVDAGEISGIREASRRLVRELGFLQGTLAGTPFSASAVHALIEIGGRDAVTAAELSDLLRLEKSSVSRMVAKLVQAGEIIARTDDEDARAKRLTLTDKGRRTLETIHSFARAQVAEALDRVPAPDRICVHRGLSLYADALAASRGGKARRELPVTVSMGYRPGIVGRAVEMHARFYARTVGFGRGFERAVAADMADFADRLDGRRNGLWSAAVGGTIVGCVAIDGDDLGGELAHLRWFIVDDGFRGAGIGRKLLAEAVKFCDSGRFAETHLWTFSGLTTARRLYEANGFVLVHEEVGRRWGDEVVEQRFVRVGRASATSRPC